MPIQYVRDANGQWTTTGEASASEMEPREFVAGSPEDQRARGFARPAGARATLGGRDVVWAGPNLGWQSPASFEKAKGQGRVPGLEPPKPAGNQRTGWSWWQNEINYLGKKAANEVKGLGAKAIEGLKPDPVKQIKQLPGFMAEQFRPGLPSAPGMPKLPPAISAAATVGVVDNATKSVEALSQWLSGAEVNPGQDSNVRQATELTYRLMGAKPPSEMNRGEADADATLRSLALNAYVSGGLAIPAAALGAGTTALGTGARAAGWFAAEEVLSTLLDDNRGGNAANLFGENAPGAVKATDDWGQATAKSLLPNALTAGLVSGVAGLLGRKGLGPAQGYIEDLRAELGFPSSRRRLQEGRNIYEVKRARKWAESKGLIVQTEDGGWANRLDAPDVVEVGGKQSAANAAPQGGAQAEPSVAGDSLEQRFPRSEEPIPTQEFRADDPNAPQQQGDFPRVEIEQGDPWVDPADFNPVGDPLKPELDELIANVWKLDDEALGVVAADPGSPLENVALELRRQRGAGPDADPRYGESAAGISMAPGEVAGFEDLDQYRAFLETETHDSLRALTDAENNPRGAQLIRSATGRAPEQATLEDMVDSLVEQAKRDGQYVLPRSSDPRYRSGEVVVPVADLGIDPKRFQFRPGADATTGEPQGGGLGDLSQWDVSREGVISAWRDPADGALYVVDGHQRVAAAQRLGLPSVPVQLIEAPDAASARFIGARLNIEGGQAGVGEAASYLRGLAPEDAAQVGGAIGAEANALRGLPDAAYAAVERGDLGTSQGALLARSGLAPADIDALAKVAAARKLSVEQLKELAGLPAPEGGWVKLSPAAQQKLVDRAKVSALVRGVIATDSALAQAAAKAGGAAPVDLYDYLKFADGPVRDLLRNAAARVANGEGIAAVADEVTGQVASAMRQSVEAGSQLPTMAERAGVQAPSAEQLSKAQEQVLTEKKLENRQRKIAELQGKESLTAAEQRALKKAEAELEADAAARQILEQQRAFETLAAEDAAAAARQAEGGADVPEAPVAEDPIGAAPVRLSAEERDALREQLVRRAINGDEVRPPLTEFPAETMAPPSVPLDRVEDLAGTPITRGSDQAQAAADELRLSMEYAYRDAVMAKRAEEGWRETTGYYDLPGQERLASDQFMQGFEDAPIDDSLPTRLAFAREQRLAAERDGDLAVARQYREIERQLNREMALAGGEVPQGLLADPSPALKQFSDAIRAADPEQQGVAWGPITAEWVDGKSLYVTRLDDLDEDRLAALGLDRAGLSRLTAAQKRDLAKEAFEQAKASLPKGEYRIEADDPSRQGDVARLLADDRDISWRSIATDKPVKKANASSYGVLKVDDTVVAKAPPAPKPTKLKASANGLVPESASAPPVTPFGPLDLANRAEPVVVPEFVLPPSLAKAAPRYGRAQLEFASDLDRTAYMLARDATSGGSKSVQKFVRALEEAGMDPAEVARYGRERVQPAVKAAAGGGAAPQREGVLAIPDQGFSGSTRLPRVERTRLEAEMAALEAEIAAADAEIARLTTQSRKGGCI